MGRGGGRGGGAGNKEDHRGTRVQKQKPTPRPNAETRAVVRRHGDFPARVEPRAANDGLLGVMAVYRCWRALSLSVCRLPASLRPSPRAPTPARHVPTVSVSPLPPPLPPPPPPPQCCQGLTKPGCLTSSERGSLGWPP